MPRNPISTVRKKDSKEIVLFRLGQAISDYYYADNPDPYENESKRKVENPATLLYDIVLATERIRTLICSDPQFEPLRRILKICGIVPSENGSSLPDTFIQTLSLVAWGDFIVSNAHNSPANYAKVLASLDGMAKDPIQAKLDARSVISVLMEKKVLVLSETYLHLSLPLQRWLAKHELSLPAINENGLNYYLNSKRYKEAQKQKPPSQTPLITSPRDLYNQLTRYVVGQDEACKALATRGWLHLKRAELIKKGQQVGNNECIFFISEQSGVGKTWLAENYGKICALPYTSFSSTDCTSVGYVGLDIVEDSLKSLMRTVGVPRDTATQQKVQQGGIIFYDEFTKKAVRNSDARDSGSSGVRDVSGGAVQQEMLRIMEGSKVMLGTRRGGDTDGSCEINTNGMMFIFGGYVDGFDKVISKLNKRHRGGMGFGGFGGLGTGGCDNKKDAYLYDALIDYGMIPEFVNRLSKVVMFRKLLPHDLVEIANSPAGVIASYNNLLKHQGMEIKITPDGILSMAELCVETGMMARGLRLIVNSLVDDAVFNQDKGDVLFSRIEVRKAIEKVISVRSSDEFGK